MKVTYNGMDNHFTVTATTNFLDELVLSEYGAYEDGCAESKDLTDAFYERSHSSNNAKTTTITIKASTAAYLTRPLGLAYHIGKWREWAGMGDFGANAYVRSGLALQKHLEAAIS
jgi:hypothetical protein